MVKPLTLLLLVVFAASAQRSRSGAYILAYGYAQSRPEGNVDLAERRKRYSLIEASRKRPLIVYATSTRPGVVAFMAADAVREFIDQIDAINGSDEVDVLVHSSGGDALTAWKLMALLRERFKRVGVLVPFMAFSAATLFALGADEIIMHPHASLGPIDPQITMPQADGKVRQFAYEDVGAFLRFLASEVKVTEQIHISTIIEKLLSVVDPVNIGAAKRASELSSSVGERLLLTHMSGSEDKSKAKEIAENLNKSFFAHGDAVSRKRAKSLHLKIADSDPDFEKILWNAYLGLEGYMELRIPFNPLQHFLADPLAALSLRLPSPLSIPPNTPPQIAQQMWQAAFQQAVQASTGPSVEVPYSIVNAVVESTSVASEFITQGTLNGFRNLNSDIQLAITDKTSGWRTV